MPAIVARIAASAAAAGLGVLADQQPTLSEYQIRCSRAHSLFVLAVPYQNPDNAVKFLEVLRSKEQAEWNERHGKGIKNSLHLLGLAADFALYNKKEYMTKTEDYKSLGLLWGIIAKEAKVTPSWGGDFGDGNHFGCAWKGIK